MRPRIATEPLTAEHAPALFGPLSEPELYRYITGSPPHSPEALATEFRRLAAGSRDLAQTWLNWVLFHEGAPVGTLQATILADRSAIVAYVVFKPNWGRGLGSEGCRWLLGELFEARGVVDALAYVDQRNEASLRLLAAVGFSRREPRDPSDVAAGDALFGLSVEGWRAPAG